MRRLMVLILAAGVLLVVAEQSARGCECAQMDSRSTYDHADGAFIGRLISHDQPTPDAGGGFSSDQSVAYHFRVDQSVKGRFGSQVDVWSAAMGASCGIESDVGRRIGLLVNREQGRWTSDLCLMIDPDALLRVSRPLPPPNGVPPAKLMISGRLGDVSTMTVDLKGRTIRYGRTTLGIGALSACPGGRRVAEVVTRQLARPPYTEWRLAVQDIESLRIVRQVVLRSLPKSSGVELEDVSCRDPEGREVLAFASMGYSARLDDPNSSIQQEGRVIRVLGRSESTLAKGAWRDAVFAGPVAFITTAPEGHTLLRLDLTTARVRTLARLPLDDGQLAGFPVASPDRRYVVFDSDSENGMKAILVDATRTPATVTTLELGEGYLVPVWWGDRAFLASSRDGAQVFDTSFRELGALKGWYSDSAVAVGNTLYGMDRGNLVVTALPHGPVRTLRRFDSSLFGNLIALPPQAKTSPRPNTATAASPTAMPAVSPRTSLSLPGAFPVKPKPVSRRGLVGGAAAGMIVLAGAAWILGRRKLSAPG